MLSQKNPAIFKSSSKFFCMYMCIYKRNLRTNMPLKTKIQSLIPNCYSAMKCGFKFGKMPKTADHGKMSDPLQQGLYQGNCTGLSLNQD